MKRPPLWLRVGVLFYATALIGAPLAFLFQQAFRRGWGAFWSALHDQAMDQALLLTAKVALIAVPLNVLFGVGVSLWIVRRPSRVSRVVDRLVDVPLAISPIIVGLILELAYAQNGWFGPALAKVGWHVMFSLPGIVMASVFVSLPLVSRQVIPLLRIIGDHQEQTAATLGASPTRVFFTITLRSVAWAVIYGVTLTLARVIGEYGAVLVVSGNIALLTQTLTLNIGANFDNYNAFQGFVGSVVLALMSIAVLMVLSIARQRERRRSEYLA